MQRRFGISRRTGIRIFIAVAVILVLMEASTFVLPAFDKTNPAVTYHIEWDSPQTEQLARTACFDCHSNETTWPWYSYVAPVSWLVTNDVNEGREVLNLSTGTGELEGEEMAEVIREGEMPPNVYLLMHPSARLSANEESQLIAGLAATFGSGGQQTGQTSGDSDD